jgi:hypothetical protein
MDTTPTLQQQQTLGTTAPLQQQETGLQQQQTSTLQNTNSQAVGALNNLDQGSSSIPLSAVSPTTTAPTNSVVVQPSTGFHVSSSIWLYGGLVIVVAIFMISLYYGLMRKK